MSELVDEGVLDLAVVQMRYESDAVLSLELADPEGGLLPEWTPGAHIDILTPSGLRQYSLCGDPTDRYHYRIGVLREPDSTGGSQFVHTVLRPGELVEVGGPRNHFALEPASSYLFIAGGIGITPLLPMIRAASAADRPWRLVYGGRRRSSMAFTGELRPFGDRVQLVVESDEGRIDLDALLRSPRAEVGIYCCGPSGLLEAVERHAVDWPEEALHIERFSARPRDANAVDRPFTVFCARSDQEVRVPAERSLLDALDRAGINVATACRDGVCGSCETAVLEGVIEHRDSVLSGAQRSTGRSMMVCVSRATSEHLVLDV